MRAVVVYESLWGNTAAIAQTIARRLENFGDVRLISVLEAGPDIAADVDLLVVGGPTHVHGMSRPSSRKSVESTAAIKEAASGPGVREWLEQLAPGGGVWMTAFDTRIDKPRWLVGAAGGPIARRLRKNGYREIIPPESFVVLDQDGPLKFGEVERADAWAGGIGQRISEKLAARTAA